MRTGSGSGPTAGRSRARWSTELRRGIYELAVHPGYLDAAADYVYHRDREWERETLADPRLPALLRDQAVELISYHELKRAVACLDRGAT